MYFISHVQTAHLVAAVFPVCDI